MRGDGIGIGVAQHEQVHDVAMLATKLLRSARIVIIT